MTFDDPSRFEDVTDEIEPNLENESRFEDVTQQYTQPKAPDLTDTSRFEDVTSTIAGATAPQRRTPADMLADQSFDPVAHIAQSADADDIENALEAGWQKYQQPTSAGDVLRGTGDVLKSVATNTIPGVASLVRGTAKLPWNYVRNVGAALTGSTVENDPEMARRARENQAGIALGFASAMKMGESAWSKLRPYLPALITGNISNIQPGLTREQYREHLLQQAAYARMMQEYRTGHIPSDATGERAGAFTPLPQPTFKDEADEAQFRRNIEDISEGWGDPTNYIPGLAAKTVLKVPFMKGVAKGAENIVQRATGATLRGAGTVAEKVGDFASGAIEKAAKSKVGQLGTKAGALGAVVDVATTGGAHTLPGLGVAAGGGATWAAGKLLGGAGRMAKEAGQEVAGMAYPATGQSFYRKATKEAMKGATAGTIGGLPLMLGAENPEEAGGMIGPAAAIGAGMGAYRGIRHGRDIEGAANFGAMVKQGEQTRFASAEEAAADAALMSRMDRHAREIINFWRGFFQGATNQNGSPIRVMPVDSATFARQTRQISRGVYFGDDGRLLINIERVTPEGVRVRNAEEIADTIAHEGKHALNEILQQSQPKLYEKITTRLKQRFLDPDGTPNQAFTDWILGQTQLHVQNLMANGATQEQINEALEGKDMDYWLEEASADIGQALMTGQPLGNFLLPQSMISSIWDTLKDTAAEIGYSIPSPGDVQQGVLQTPSAQAVTRAIRQQLHLQGQEARRRMEATQRDAGQPATQTPQGPPEPAQTVQQRIDELERILATPPLPTSTVDENNAYRKARLELNRLRKQFPRPLTSPAGGPPPLPKSAPSVPKVDAQSRIGSTFNGPEGQTITITGISAEPPDAGSIVVDQAGKAYRVTKAWSNGSAEVAYTTSPLNSRSSLTLPAGTFTHVTTDAPQAAPQVPPSAAPATPIAVAPATPPPASGAPQVAPEVVGGTGSAVAAPAKPRLTARPTTGGAWEIVDENGDAIRGGYADESAANRAIAQFNRETRPSFQLPQSANGNDVIDAVLEQTSGNGIFITPEQRENADHLFPFKGIWHTKLTSGQNSRFKLDEVARLVHAEGHGDGTEETLLNEMAKAVEGRRSFNKQMRDAEKAERRQQREATAEEKARVQAVVQAAKEQATAAEKNTKTKAAQERIRLAQIDAILDAIGDDQNGLHRVTDATGETTIIGNYDPNNPWHAALTQVAGKPLTKEAKVAVARMQGAEGRVQHILYRSAEKPGIAGEGGEGSVPEFTTSEREKDYEAQPAEERATGQHQGTVQQKSVIPIETFARTTDDPKTGAKAGEIRVRFFTLDNILHNIRSVFDHLREKGQRNPYGDDPAQQEAQIIADMNDYAENHANGVLGDGSGPIQRFPGDGLPAHNPAYPPKVIPAERFHLLNAALVEDAASRTAKVQNDVTEKREAIATMPAGKAKDNAQAALNRLIAREAKLMEIYNIADLNGRTINTLTGETNPYRDQLRAEGFDFSKFKSPIETLHPGNILEVADDRISTPPGEVLDVRPTGFAMDPAELGKSGRPIRKAVQANFMPETAGVETASEPIKERAARLWKEKGTDSPFFKRWFGDSKVVDEEGNPLVVYHGSTKKFDAFDKAKLGSATGAASAFQGMFFTNDRLAAEGYGSVSTDRIQRGRRIMDKADAELKKLGTNWVQAEHKFVQKWLKNTPTGWTPEQEKPIQRLLKNRRKAEDIMEAAADDYTADHSPSPRGQIIEAYLKLENPLIHDQQGKEFRDESFYGLTQKAKAGGHDGVIIRDTHDPGLSGAFTDGEEMDVYIVFEPTQIKSADNRGTFDTEDASIRFMPENDQPVTPKDAARQRMAERAGAVYQGTGTGDLAAFKELTTNSNFSIKEDELTPDRIQQEAEKVRQSYQSNEQIDTPEKLEKWMREQGMQFMPEGQQATDRKRAEAELRRRLGSAYNNIAQLAMRESEQVMKAVPSLQELAFDFKTGKIRKSDGTEVTPPDITKMLEAAGKANTYDKGIGLSTAQRAIITKSAFEEAEAGTLAGTDRGRGNRVVKEQRRLLYMPEEGMRTEDIRKHVADAAQVSERLNGNKAWLTWGGHWINVNDHNEVMPITYDDATGDIKWSASTADMNEAGFARIEVDPLEGKLYLETRRPTSKQLQEAKDTAVERGLEFVHDRGAFMPETTAEETTRRNILRSIIPKIPIYTESDTMEKSRAWLAPSGKWVNVKYHGDLHPIFNAQQIGPAESRKYTDLEGDNHYFFRDMHEIGYKRVVKSGDRLIVDANPNTLTARQKQSLKDTAIERNATLSYDKNGSWMEDRKFMPEQEDRKALIRDDMVKQTAFFRQQMRAAGYENLNEVPEELLAKWSEQWREENPRTNPDGSIRFQPEIPEGSSQGEELAREAAAAGVNLSNAALKLLLMENPDTMERIRQQIRQKTGKDARFMPDDRDSDPAGTSPQSGQEASVEVLFHQTASKDDFDAFKPSPGRPEIYYFSTRKDVLSRMIKGGMSKDTSKPNRTIKARITTNNPLNLQPYQDKDRTASQWVSLFNKLGIGVPAELSKRANEAGTHWIPAWQFVRAPGIREAMIAAGYDGVKFDEWGGTTTGVFSPSQIERLDRPESRTSNNDVLAASKPSDDTLSGNFLPEAPQDAPAARQQRSEAKGMPRYRQAAIHRQQEREMAGVR